MAPVQAIRDDILRRARAEYLEMPGLRLTSAQAQRLWGLDRPTCDKLLAALTERRFRSKTRAGSFVLTASRM